MRKISLLFLLALMLTGLQSEAQVSFSGPWSPDVYGYQASVSTFNWIDIRTKTYGALDSIVGLGDDASHGPVNMGFNFHYYWSDYSTLKIGSNGWTSFNNPGNIAHCFPDIPTQGGAADNIVAPFMTDLNPAGTGNPGRIFYWSNNADTFIVTYQNMPFWVNALPDWSGSNTFQVIFAASDSSITFQYEQMDDFNNTTGCTEDLVAGIENITGNVGIKVAQETPSIDNHAIHFTYPATPGIAIADATPSWNANADNEGQFYVKGTQVNLQTNIANVGNDTLSNSTTAAGEVENLAFSSIWTDNATAPPLNPGEDTTLTFAAPVTFTAAGQYYYNVTATNSGDMNPSNNQNTVEISVVEPQGDSIIYSYSTLTNYTVASQPDGSISWSGGGGNSGVGVYMEPPYYPITVSDVMVWIWQVAFDSTNNQSGFIINIIDDDSPDPTTGTVMQSDTFSKADYNLHMWQSMPLSQPVTITSGGFYVEWLMAGDSIAIGTEQFGPVSRRSWEILGGNWAKYRMNTQEDFLLAVVTDTLGFPVANDKEVDPRATNLITYPNPVNSIMNVLYEVSHSGTVNFTLMDLQGRVVDQRSYQAIAGKNQYEFDAATLNNGVYFLKMETAAGSVVKKVVITH